MSAREPLPPRGERAKERRDRAALIISALHEAYPDAGCALSYSSPFQLLIATILSAQCTDQRVNQVTPALFDRFPDAQSMSQASTDELEDIIRSTGFFRQKARNILACSQQIIDRYAGDVPRSVDEIATLPGAARKTANVVVSNCFPEDASGIAVDTHVQRIVRRLGLVRAFPPEQVERELMRTIAPEEWNHLTHLLIDHGRAVCTARAPACDTCPISGLCPSAGLASARQAASRGHGSARRSTRA